MSYDVTAFGLSDMVACSADLRACGEGAEDLHEVAGRIVDHLYDALRTDDDERACVLARFFKTTLYEELSPELQDFADAAAGGASLMGRRCLTLEATRGVEEAWNDPAASDGHRAIPLISVESVVRSPMIAQLIHQLGLDTTDVVEPDQRILVDLAQQTYNVFHVDETRGSPHVPDQAGFVEPYGVRSAVGFGGMLPTGELFAVILFTRIPVTREVAQRFRTLSLSVKAAILPHARPDADVTSDLRSKLTAVEELLSTHEEATTSQARVLENTSRGLRELARASIAINSTMQLEDMLQLITDEAREIIGAHQSVTSLTVGDNWAQSISAVSLSDKYAQWRDYDQQPDGSGIYARVCQEQRPFRMTQAELEAHPAWRAFGEHAPEHPPMRGWLAAPLTARDGSNIGLIQLSDRYEGEFTADDESILVQLAQMASVAIENLRLADLVAQEEAARSREELLAGLSHDMKTPLAIIGGLSAALREEPDGEIDERVEAYDALSRQVGRLRALVQRFLDYSALEAGRSLQVHPAPTSLREVVEDVVPLYSDRTDIVVEVPADLPLAMADGERLEQVLSNLLSNAVKFSDGSPVTVRGEAHEGQVLLHVIDQGIGMDAFDRTGLFQKFRRGNNAKGTDGSGLGLYISYALVTAQGGDIEVVTRPGAGSTFTVSLVAADGGSA